MTYPLTTADSLSLAIALAQAKAPADVYRAVEHLVARGPGAKLFTLLVLTKDGEAVQRVYSNNEQAYPLAGQKRMGPTPWGDLVLARAQTFLGHNADDIRWAFPDHELIASLGLASAINIPIVAMGRVLGTLNALDVAGHYSEIDVQFMQALSPVLAVPFLRELGGF
jgi:GAF domain-containing protein